MSSPQRDALVPDIPTIAEAGVAGYRAELWFGLLVAAQVPKPIVARLNNEISRILNAPEVKQRWAPIGLDPRPGAPADFDKLVASDIDVFGKIVRAANIKAE